MYIPTFTYGKLPVEVWEYPAMAFYILALSIVCAQYARMRVRHDPSWRFFLPGLWVKLGGGLFFALIYILYYDGGDTTSYFECAMAYSKLLFANPEHFLTALMGGGTPEIKSLFTAETGSPMGYMFYDDKTRTVVKLCIPFVLLGGQSYLLATLLLATATYGGLWRLYRMFVGYFPDFRRYLAIGILFMPSVVFWGSGILKDSFTLAATCYFIVATNGMINRKGKLWSILGMLVSGSIILAIKPYILLILFPGTLVWYFYKRIRQIRNVYFRYIIVPFIYLIIIAGSYLALTSLGDQLGRFSLDRALETAAVIQHDLKQDYYSGASFDIGELEATPISLLQKFPLAVSAGLFRPFIWESRNMVMLLSGLENLFILLLTVYVVFRFRFKVIWSLIKDYPLVLYSFVFAILFAFMIGVTTSNFGALVRFKIPLIPLYIGSLMVLYGQLRQLQLTQQRRGKRNSLSASSKP